MNIMTALQQLNPFRREPEFNRWNPFEEMERMQHRMNSLFSQLGRRTEGQEPGLTATEWLPLVDITEDAHEYLITTELPGLAKEAVKVRVLDGVLVITGERTLEEETSDRKHHRIERAYGSFARRFTLPDDADSAKVTAEFREGVLTVHLPKDQNAQPKSIEVKVD